MQKITPSIWFEKDIEGIVSFYKDAFGDVEVISRTTLPDTPSGDAGYARVKIFGYDFSLLAAGSMFKANPSISYMVSTRTAEEVDALWNKLIVGGKALMELGAYPFSPRYGWLEDKYGVSWQIMTVGDMPIPKIVPRFTFVGDIAGKAEEAMTFYGTVFKDAKEPIIARYGAGMEPDKEGTVMHAMFEMEGQTFSAMDSAHEHHFAFTEGNSFEVRCKDQEEIDYYWEKLTAHPESEQCGWLKDKYGVSWQIVPIAMDQMMSEGTPAQIQSVMAAFMPMKKLEIAPLEEAYTKAA